MLNPPETAVRAAEMMARFLGPTVMSGMEDEDVTGIVLNPTDLVIRFDTRSRGRIESGARLTAAQAIQFLNAAASHVGVSLTSSQPLLQAELPEPRFHGARLQGFVPPVTAGPALIIRKPASVVFSLDEYENAGILSPHFRRCLRTAVQQRWNLLVIGGTGTGKSTLVNALLREVAEHCSGDRVLILEDTVELRCSSSDFLALRKPEGGTLADLVKAALRADPTRIVVGEMRDAVALDWLDASSTGHPGSMATLHATSPDGALLRLDRLAQRAGVPPQRELIAEAVDLIIHLQGSHSTRQVTSLTRVHGLDSSGRYLLSPVEAS